MRYENGENIGNYTTDANGTITVSKLRQGNIIVKEVEVPENYIIDESNKYVNLEYNSTSNLEVTNNLKRGNLKVIKVGTYITDQNGEIKIEGLKIGNYILKETKENPNYYKLNEDTNVEIEWNKTTTTKIENEKLKGRIRVIKLDEDFNTIKLPNVKFEIINSENNVVETIITNSNGEATTSRLPIGEYRIKEISTGDDNYILNEQNKHVIIQKDKTTEIVVTNLHKKGNVTVFKVDKDNNKITLGNVKFDLYSMEFQKVIGTYTTDVNRRNIY